MHALQRPTVKKLASFSNVQNLYKRKSKFVFKTRRRKFKKRVLNARPIRIPSGLLARPRVSSHYSLVANNACRIRFDVFVGAEKGVSAAKKKLYINYNRYPDTYVTKKSKKARMGKGKGKITGRLWKVQKGQGILDLKIRHPFKSRKIVTAVKRTMPTTVKLVTGSHFVQRAKTNFYSARWWMNYRRKKKKRPFWAKKVIPKIECKLPTWSRLSPDFYRRILVFKRRQNFMDVFRLLYGAAHSRAGGLLAYPPLRGVSRGHYRPRHLENCFYSAGSGGAQRCAWMKRRILQHHTREMYESIFIPDIDGFVGIYKHANLYISRMKEKHPENSVPSRAE